MPTVDVTSPVTAGLNALSDVAGGVVQGHSLASRMQDQRQARLDDVEYRDMLLKARNRELGQRAQEHDREMRFREDDAAIRAGFEERRIKLLEGEKEDMTEAGEYVARMTEKTLGTGTVENFEEEMRAQRANAIRFASGVGPKARALILAGLDDDERLERRTLAQRAAKTAWESAMTNPLLADGSGMAEEMKALAMENIEALESGAETPAQSMRDLEEIRGLARKKIAKLKDFQWGLDWSTQQIAEGGGDIEAMHMAQSDYETMGPEHADLTDLKRRILRAKHNVEMDTVKLGKIEVPRSIKVGTPEWRDVAESAAEEEVLDLLSRDPWLKDQIDRGVYEDDDSGYRKHREEVRRRVMRRYAAQSGATRTQMAQMGLLEDPKVVEKNSRSEIEKRLRAAGIDPNQKIRPASAQPSSRSDVNRRQPVVPAEPEPPLGSPQRPMLDKLKPATEAVDAETFDEEDIDEVYRDSDG